MIDGLGREIDYLRISVTPECDLRCFYCLPSDLGENTPHLLAAEEIIRFVRVAASSGIKRVRLTGGEPLLRRDLERIISGIKSISGITEVSMTTNAQRLAGRARALGDAGLDRVNISLDTLQPERYRRFTNGGDISNVFLGIRSAEQAELTPIRLNTVVVKEVNDDELMRLACLTEQHPWDVRFIELMPIGEGRNWHSRVVSSREIWQALGRPPKEAAEVGGGPAEYYRFPGAPGRIGIISAVSEHFCGTCNRIRLTAQGTLRPCLLDDHELDIRSYLGDGQETALAQQLHNAIRSKPSAQPDTPGRRRRMAEIGG